MPIADGELKTTISDSLKYQRRGLAVIVCFILSLAVGAGLNINVASRARQLGNQLRSSEKAPSEQQQLLEEAAPSNYRLKSPQI